MSRSRTLPRPPGEGKRNSAPSQRPSLIHHYDHRVCDWRRRWSGLIIHRYASRGFKAAKPSPKPNTGDAAPGAAPGLKPNGMAGSRAG